MHFLRPTWTPTGHTAQYSFLKVGATNDNPNQREKAALAWRAFCVPNLLLRIRGSRVRNQGRASLHRDRAGLGDRAEVPAPETSPQWGLESPEEVPLGLGAPPSLATPEQRRGGGLLRESFVDEAPFQRHYHNSRPLGICYQPEASLPRLELGGKGLATGDCTGRLSQQHLYTCCCCCCCKAGTARRLLLPCPVWPGGGARLSEPAGAGPSTGMCKPSRPTNGSRGRCGGAGGRRCPEVWASWMAAGSPCSRHLEGLGGQLWL